MIALVDSLKIFQNGVKMQAGSFLFALLAEAFIIYASVLVKLSTLPPTNVGFYRIILALPFFLLLAFLRGQLKALVLKDVALMCLAGACFGCDLLFFNIALLHTTVANVNLIAALACFVLVPIGMIFFGEKMRKRFVVGALVALMGVFVLIFGRGELSVATPFGDFMATLSMIFYSFFLSLTFSLRRKYGALCIMSFACVGSCAVLALFVGVLEGFQAPPNPHEWLIIALIALFGQLLGQGFFSYILARLGAQIASLVLLCAPASAAIMGFILLDERLNAFEICGIIIIMWGVYITKRV